MQSQGMDAQRLGSYSVEGAPSPSWVDPWTRYPSTSFLGYFIIYPLLTSPELARSGSPPSNSKKNGTDNPAQTCKYLRAILEEHHVWLELFTGWRSKNTSVTRYAPPPTALSTAELRSFIVQRARVDRYWATSTVLTSPVPHFTFQASIPLQFCKLLPGGKHLIFVYRNGDISLQSLVDLDDIHEIADHKLSLDPQNGHVHIVSLVADYKGRLLLAVCTYGLPSRYLHVYDLHYLADHPQNFPPNS